jgi:2-methylisocitrate lyase-like PEP mutase family enzyme
MSRLGMADLGLINFTDMLTNAEMIASINPSVPVIVRTLLPRCLPNI